MQCHVYIMASHSRTLYVGVTRDLVRRVYQHRTFADPDSFTSRYRISKLVYFEGTPSLLAAIAREKEIKGWRRDRKVALVEAFNLDWRDLAHDWFRSDSRKILRCAQDEEREG